jgi:hypothetical protein
MCHGCLASLVGWLTGQSGSPIVVENGPSVCFGQRTIITYSVMPLRLSLFNSPKVFQSMLKCQENGHSYACVLRL